MRHAARVIEWSGTGTLCTNQMVIGSNPVAPTFSPLARFSARTAEMPVNTNPSHLDLLTFLLRVISDKAGQVPNFRGGLLVVWWLGGGSDGTRLEKPPSPDSKERYGHMANSRLKLTQTAVTRLIREHDGKKKARHWDTEVPKMFLAITPNGSATYKLLIVKPDGSRSDTRLIAANEALSTSFIGAGLNRSEAQPESCMIRWPAAPHPGCAEQSPRCQSSASEKKAGKLWPLVVGTGDTEGLAAVADEVPICQRALIVSGSDPRFAPFQRNIHPQASHLKLNDRSGGPQFMIRRSYSYFMIYISYGLRPDNDFRISIAGAQAKTALFFHEGQ